MTAICVIVTSKPVKSNFLMPTSHANANGVEKIVTKLRVLISYATAFLNCY